MLYQRKSNPWIFSPQKRTLAPHLRLFCLPYAGGGASIYHPWSSDLAPAIEVCAIQLPGRENRFSELPYTNLTQLIETLAPILMPYLDIPFAFFGHSMGALISFELARYFQREAGIEPVYLFVSGHRAPHLARTHRPLHALPTADFIQELRQLNGTPEAVLQNDSLFELLLPVLRADFELCETYTYGAQNTLSCPILAIGGLQDSDISCDAIEGWREHTEGQFGRRFFPGDHFFLNQHRYYITRLIMHKVSQNTVCSQSCNQLRERVS
jgi:medium-chain acyl-[acyl-carrier-protein] hydrolase